MLNPNSILNLTKPFDLDEEDNEYIQPKNMFEDNYERELRNEYYSEVGPIIDLKDLQNERKTTNVFNIFKKAHIDNKIKKLEDYVEQNKIVNEISTDIEEFVY
jgi:hypothetical protein